MPPPPKERASVSRKILGTPLINRAGSRVLGRGGRDRSFRDTFQGIDPKKK